MTTVKVSIYVSDLASVMTLYDRIKVYRSATETGTFVEISSAPTRPVLVTGTTIYSYYDTTAPTALYWYKTSYYHSTSLLESDLSSAMQGTDAGLYCTLDSLRSEGITVAELTDERALMLILDWQQWFEKMTGNFFTQRSITLDFDGDGSSVLWLPFPIISCTNLYINDDFTTVVDPTYYIVYNSRVTGMDDRRNPRIKLKRSSGSYSIFTQSYGSKFAIGERNIRVEGVWGYTESDGSVPSPVARAIRILVMSTKDLLSDSDIDQLKFGKVTEEVTDRHRIKYSDLFDTLKKWDITGITEVDRAIASYRAPVRVTAPRNVGLFV